MHHGYSLQISLLLVALAPCAALAAGPDRPAAKSAAALTGRVSFQGQAPAASTLPMSSDPKCRQQHPKGFRYEPIVVDASGGLSETFVRVKSGLDGKRFPTPAEKVVLDQRGCWYMPRVVGAMVGQTVEIRNSDPTMHNVNALPEFNAAMPASVKAIEKKFTKPDIMRTLKCNVHPWMTAFVGVVENPFYAVSGKDGTFEIKGLAPGKYTLEAWHDKLGTVSQDVTVGAQGAKVEMKFHAPK
ncbi:MAG: hypothetical protein HY078_10885 [Elusimicrobia bacterium]|nr:hypothetical protein [Elusimicrobiota bacterium]